MNFVPPLAGSVNLGMGLVIAAVAIGIAIRVALFARQGKQIFSSSLSRPSHRTLCRLQCHVHPAYNIAYEVFAARNCCRACHPDLPIRSKSKRR
jgi:hypothetical protein